MKQNKSDSQLIYGRHPIIQALNENKGIEKVFIKDSLSGDLEKEVRQLCKQLSIPLKRVPQIKLDKLTRFRNHQGLVAFKSLINYVKITDIIPFLYEQGLSPIIVVLDNVQDVRNVGAIGRSAEVLGAHVLIISGNKSALINEDAIKASAGALDRLAIVKAKNTIDIIADLREYGIRIVGSSLSGQSSYLQDMKGPICIVLGAEGQGLHHSVEQCCDELIKIPQSGKTDSLNVSVAAGILLYEIARQSSAE